MVEFCAVTPAFVAKLSRTLRDADRAECYREGFPSPFIALEASVAASALCLGVLIDSQPAAAFGVVVTQVDGALGPPLEGIAWALTGKAVDACPFGYLRHSRAAVKCLLDYCPVLHNQIDARYAKALRWAKWCGFTLGEPVGLPPYGLPFVRAELRR